MTKLSNQDGRPRLRVLDRVKRRNLVELRAEKVAHENARFRIRSDNPARAKTTGTQGYGEPSALTVWNDLAHLTGPLIPPPL
jgi:hypothetical protein